MVLATRRWGLYGSISIQTHGPTLKAQDDLDIEAISASEAIDHPQRTNNHADRHLNESGRASIDEPILRRQQDTLPRRLQHHDEADDGNKACLVGLYFSHWTLQSPADTCCVAGFAWFMYISSL